MDMRVIGGCDPFLKWPGGKRWASNLLKLIIEANIEGRYFEPFVGGAAVYLRLRPEKAVLSDINKELINCLNQVATYPFEIIERLSKLKNNKESYYKLRAENPECSLEAAVRFIYLNKAAWGGMYRLNRQGKFNVPFGNSGREILDSMEILKASEGLNRATLLCADFETSMAGAVKGDVIYADPPYSLPSNEGSFLRYNDKIFGWDDQVRLSNAAKIADRKGVKVIVSGPWNAQLFDLYPNWYVVKLTRTSTIACKVDARKAVFESLICNFDPRRNVGHPNLKETYTIDYV